MSCFLEPMLINCHMALLMPPLLPLFLLLLPLLFGFSLQPETTKKPDCLSLPCQSHKELFQQRKKMTKGLLDREARERVDAQVWGCPYLMFPVLISSEQTSCGQRIYPSVNCISDLVWSSSILGRCYGFQEES